MVKWGKERLGTTGYQLLLDYNPPLAKESGYSAGIGSNGLLVFRSEAVRLAGNAARVGCSILAGCVLYCAGVSDAV